MRDLHIHIGLPKTGTSYIQATLVRNAAPLLAAGVGIGPYIAPGDGESFPLRHAIRDQGPGAVMARLAESPGDKLVISSEQLADGLHNRSFAEPFRDAARAHFNPKIILFLRRQDHLKESIFAQVVKNWYCGSIADENHFFYDHDRRVSELEALFGAENVTVVLYHDGGPKNDILGAFFAAIGLEAPREALGEVGAQNVSLHRRKLLLLSQVPKPDPDIQDVAHLMTRVVGRSSAIADDGGRFMMSPRVRHDLMARYLEGNRAIVARHGIAEAGAFAEAPDPDTPWTPPAPITRAEFAAISAETFAYCARIPGKRHGLKMAGKMARVLPRMAYRLFVTPPPGGASRPPTSDMLPA